jgi:formylglycine-generating enzyme required for sulfatase activity
MAAASSTVGNPSLRWDFRNSQWATVVSSTNYSELSALADKFPFPVKSSRYIRTRNRKNQPSYHLSWEENIKDTCRKKRLKTEIEDFAKDGTQNSLAKMCSRSDGMTAVLTQ